MWSQPAAICRGAGASAGASEQLEQVGVEIQTPSDRQGSRQPPWQRLVPGRHCLHRPSRQSGVSPVQAAATQSEVCASQTTTALPRQRAGNVTPGAQTWQAGAGASAFSHACPDEQKPFEQ